MTAMSRARGADLLDPCGAGGDHGTCLPLLCQRNAARWAGHARTSGRVSGTGAHRDRRRRRCDLRLGGNEWMPHTANAAEQAAGANVDHGTTDDIVESLLSFPAFECVDDLQAAVPFGTRSLAHGLMSSSRSPRRSHRRSAGLRLSFRFECRSRRMLQNWNGTEGLLPAATRLRRQ